MFSNDEEPMEVVQWDEDSCCSTEEEHIRQQQQNTSLLYQLEKKYFSDENQTLDSSLVITLYGTSPCQAATEGELRVVILENMGITHIGGDLSRFQLLAKNVRDLDLSSNKINSWLTVNTLLKSLPSLRSLNLGHNPLNSSEISPAEAISVSPQLTTLILIGIDLPLAHIFCLMQRLPLLRELHLSQNNYSRVDDLKIPSMKESERSSLVFSNLSALYMTSCQIRKWADIFRIIHLFPNIKSLFLSENPIESIEKDIVVDNGASASVGEFLRSLHTLILNNTRLGSWYAIENLEVIGGLQDLRCANIPLLVNYSLEERRHLIIGRLSNLRSLNGSLITEFQREESERFFIRYYQNAENKPVAYDRLVAKHGQLEQLVKIDLTPTQFAQVMISCEETGYEEVIKVRLRNTVQKLMKYIEKKTGISPRKMRLFYVDSNVYALGPSELKNASQMLQSLHIEDGDKFLVMSKTV